MTLLIELFELAIDFLEDPESLKATSLVCRAWLPRTRVNLFRVLALCHPYHVDNLARLLSSSPHVAPYVEELDISENSWSAFLRPSMAVVARFPHILLDFPLVQPRRLHVHHQLWLPTLYSPEYLTSLSSFSTITSLDVYDVTFTTFADFAIILRALGRLSSLSAKHLDCQRLMSPATAADIGCILPCLTTLRVGSYEPSSVIDWLLQYNSFPVVRDVECLYELSPHHNDYGLGAFWENSGATLETLYVSFWKQSAGYRLSMETIERQFDLSNCRRLRKLRFDCRHERGVAPDWTWLRWLLSHLTCRTLRAIEFLFQSSSHALASVHAFSEQLDSTITSAVFSDGLESVSFKFDFRDPADTDDQRFLELFPSLRARGLLRVKVMLWQCDAQALYPST
ncbi:hypothetical protein BD413DRAFT_601892 [Trametes elegans]|nr:hypothetical protein BD413DRAFT_601892 [Trametes elegans]